jgi:(p)ppGpp synthase/HD superfamily hydrolase
LKSLRRTEAIALGQRLLNQALGEFQLSLDEVTADAMNAAVGELGMKDMDELFERIGLGERLAPLVARRLLPANPEESGSASPAPLAVAGTEGLLVTYARCCFPIPNDPIFAFLSSGRGIVIHRENCVNVEDYRKHPEKWLPVAWQTPVADRVFSSQMRVDVRNRMGVLAAIAAAIASTETNIDHVSLEERDSDTSALLFEIKVRDRKHLAHIVRTIRRMPDVLRVTRTIAAHSRKRPET